ncbi:MAG: fumarate hydratase [Deltaproteobacteria bacterium]|jgi:fumarate hydratase subunit alpha|nr:fumarate hydratase [Deltaproteobacteria bacterium]
MTRILSTDVIEETVRSLFLSCAFRLPDKVKAHLALALEKENSAEGRSILSTLIKNHGLAQDAAIPLCQDTGLAQILIELGQEVSLVGRPLSEAVSNGAKAAYGVGYLRKSTCHPLERNNRGDNSPASLETLIVPGDQITVIVLAKGGGCDNKCRMVNLVPTTSKESIIKTIVSLALEAGPDACPPYCLGVAVGGSFESAPRLARRALVDLWEDPPMSPEESDLAETILTQINASGLGPMGLGGRVTALGLRLKLYPCHLASLPVAVNVNCHSLRTARATF